MTKHVFKPGEKEQVAAMLGLDVSALPNEIELEDIEDDEDEDDSDEILAEDEDEDEDEEIDSDDDEDDESEEIDEDDEEDDEDSDAEEQDLGIKVQAATDEWLKNHKDEMSLADYLKTQGF